MTIKFKIKVRGEKKPGYNIYAIYVYTNICPNSMSQKELINEAEKAPLLIELNVSNFKITGLSLELHF